ncbi:MAG: sialate O-acetylesterase [Granulosicoccus sp.]
MIPSTLRNSLNLTASLLVLIVTFLVAACSGNDSTDRSRMPSSGDFELAVLSSPLQLREGDPDGLTIVVNLIRNPEHTNPVDLKIEAVTTEDVRLVSTSGFTNSILTPSSDTSQVKLLLAIDTLPIQPQTRDFVITATDGAGTSRQNITIDVLPTTAPDVYLLAGQSNMVGISGTGTRQAEPGGPDESHPRIKQLNATKNERDDVFNSASAYTSRASNIIESAPIVIAEDPLHLPLDPNNSGKDSSYIGLGLSFAKAALDNTTADIILVPAAWSGSSFCRRDSPTGYWNAESSSNPLFNDTLLFDRAVFRTNLALTETGGVLRGILWHQGESDELDECAGELGETYRQNLTKMIAGFRTSIQTDLAGESRRQGGSNIPFVLGTMSAGADEREDLSTFLPSKQFIDDVHRLIPSQVTYTALSNHDDLKPSDGYPCGNTSCIHFGAKALREMGRRYYEGLLRAVQNRID